MDRDSLGTVDLEQLLMSHETLKNRSRGFGVLNTFSISD
jgi:hypothetical protein